jgi:hypothetical protein
MRDDIDAGALVAVQMPLRHTAMPTTTLDTHTTGRSFDFEPYGHYSFARTHDPITHE